MSFWSRITNAFRADRTNREIDEELQSHLDDAIAQGRDPAEATRALGSALRQRESSRDIKIIPWLDSLRADAILGLRRLRQQKITSAAAILSLALAIGVCTSAFRLIDAMLLRPMPVSNPERLYTAGRQGVDPGGHFRISDSWEYPLFQQMRPAVKDQAELIAASDVVLTDITYSSDQEMERAHRQFVSGWMFADFGLKPALGRLLRESDDLEPGAHPYAVLTYDYWNRRFGRDPNIVGHTFQMEQDLYTIVGVCEPPFTGTEPGMQTDIFVPTMMHAGVSHSDWSWFRTFVHLKQGASLDPLHDRLLAIVHGFDLERSKSFYGFTKENLDKFLKQEFVLQPAAGGASYMQETYRRSLLALGVLVVLVLLIACVNVANLMTAQASARAREMALRVSIGAGRLRLIQLVLIEGVWIAIFASVIGALFAWWSAPIVVSQINPPDNPARLALPADFRVLGFSLALAAGVALLFGLAPALRASSVKPVSALKGGEDPHSRPRLMQALIAAQVAFCFLVVFISSLFVSTFTNLSNQPNGFSADRVITLDTVAKSPQPPVYWDQVADHLRALSGVERVAISGWPLIDGNGWNGFVAVNGEPPSQSLAYFLSVSPGFIDTMKISLISGRDFLPDETAPGVVAAPLGAAIVNEAFVEAYFNGENPIGKSFGKIGGNVTGQFRFHVVGVVGNARYRNLREPFTPTAYVPFHSTDAHGVLRPQRKETFVVRTSGANPLAMASTFRQEVSRTAPQFRVTNIRTQSQINQSSTVRERLLATLALFFAGVALLLAGIGLYGVLHYSVMQRRREIGIRMALGAQAFDIARRVTAEVFLMVFTGAIAGLALGFASVRYIESLLYNVKSTDISILAIPTATILTAALLAALPGVIRAVRIDPVKTLRTE